MIPIGRMRPILKLKDNGNIFIEQWIRQEIQEPSLPYRSSAIEGREGYETRNITEIKEIS